MLLEELCRRLAEEVLGARLLALTLHRVDGESASLAIGTARPSRDVAHLMRLFAERIERIDPGLGIEDMVLAAKTVEKLEARQLAFDSRFRGNDGKPQVAMDDDTSVLIDRLANRLGARSVGRLLPHDAHLPERAQRFVFAFAPGGAAWERGSRARCACSRGPSRSRRWRRCRTIRR